MNILFYTIIFIIGIVLGSYWSIKAEELPKSLDMKKIHYSNKSNEEIISKVSYTLIGGMSTVILANILNINTIEFDFSKITIYIFAMLYISTLVLIAGIDRKYLKIDKRVLAFGVVSSILYMLYLFVIDLTSVHLNIIYLGIYMVVLLIDSFLLKKFAKDSYIINILMLLAIILAYTDLRTVTYTIIMSIIAIVLYVFFLKIQQRKNYKRKIKINEIPVGYFIAASNIMIIFMIRVFENYLI